MDLFSAVLTLFLILDPLGNIPAFLAVLENVQPERRRRVLARELLLALVVMLSFLFGGEYLLRLLSLETESLQIAGGIVLFLIALRMIFPTPGGVMGEFDEGEPFLVPLAIPLLAGPSIMATLILLVNSEPQRMAKWVAAVLIAWGISAVVMLSSTMLYRVLGKKGLVALERLMGMLLVALAVQMCLAGIAEYWELLHRPT
jgi:multiple antibiotic resistance protein